MSESALQETLQTFDLAIKLQTQSFKKTLNSSRFAITAEEQKG